MAKAGLIQIQGSKNYSFDDFKNDLTERGAVIVVNATTFRRYPWSFEPGHPTGAEPGNWYRKRDDWKRNAGLAQT
jgi:hypothetical protein